jgi:hypothetical protein
MSFDAHETLEEMWGHVTILFVMRLSVIYDYFCNYLLTSPNLENICNYTTTNVQLFFFILLCECLYDYVHPQITTNEKYNQLIYIYIFHPLFM